MCSSLRADVLVGFVAAAASVLLSASAPAQTVWTGLTYNFTKPPGANELDPTYQDAITPNVKLTRGGSGLYNAASETSYDMINYISPEHTLWATNIIPANAGETISATNWANLVFTDWRTAYGGANQLKDNIIATNAVVYLTTDDIYLDLQFNSWPGGFGAAGAFSYLRSEPPEVPEPAAGLLTAAGMLGLAIRRRRRKNPC